MVALSCKASSGVVPTVSYLLDAAGAGAGVVVVPVYRVPNLRFELGYCTLRQLGIAEKAAVSVHVSQAFETM